MINAEVRDKRFRIFFIAISCFALIILSRYALLMLKPSPSPVGPDLVLPEAARGPILDKNGNLLAVQTQLYSVSLWRPDLTDPQGSAELLARVLGLEEDSLRALLTNERGSNFVWIKRQVSPAESKDLEALMQGGRLKGIRLEPEPGRHYPQKSLASHVVGYVGTDNVGLDGIEYTLNDILSPTLIGEDSPTYGNRVYLTVDINVQNRVETILKRAYEEYQPDNMMAIVMEAKTGDIAAYLSLPQFDPNHFQDYSAAQRKNQLAQMAYEPGSVFKIFSLSSFLELGGITPDVSYDTTGGFNPDYFQKYDIAPITDLGNYGVLDLQGVLNHSSNVGTAYASETVETKEYYAMLRSFGFGKSTGLPLPGESNGLLKEPEQWSLRSKPTISIGQEVGVSALQMVTAATVFANGGVLLKPHIIKKIESPEGELIKEYDREVVREVLSPETAKTMLEMMRGIVDSPVGTTRRARIDDFPISAKSGTAQITNLETGKYYPDRFTASVLALFPTEDPQLIVYIVLKNPRGDIYYGGTIGSPLVKEIARDLAPYYHIPLIGNEVYETDGRVTLTQPRSPEPSDIIPDFTGMSKREALRFFADGRAGVTMKGEGRVIFQFPRAGMPLQENQIIFLEFE
ncbi:MAG: PASTA domain-containing protein [Spirochaetales bacterium]|nr:PASTA domain-containing protein [Spirochaetales bacterium]